jgi:hypothetical protein
MCYRCSEPVPCVPGEVKCGGVVRQWTGVDLVDEVDLVELFGGEGV